MDSKQPVPRATHHDLFDAWTNSSDAAEATMIMEATFQAYGYVTTGPCTMGTPQFPVVLEAGTSAETL